MSRVFLLWLCTVVLACTVCRAQKAQPRITNQDVIELVSLGFSDDLILDKIRTTQGSEFDTSIAALKALKAANVSDSVIRAMIDTHAETPSVSSQRLPRPAPGIVSEVGVYFVVNGFPTEVEPEIVNWQTGGFAKTHASLGLVKGDVNGKISRPTSANQVPMPLEIIVKTPEGTSVTEYQLLHLHRKDSRREFRAVTGGVIHKSGGAQRDDILFEPEKISERTWRIRLDGLSAGEYGLLPPGVSSASISASGKMYTFRVGQKEQDIVPQTQTVPVAPAAGSDSLTITVGHPSIGASTTGNPDERHDGVTISHIQSGGPAERVGLKAGDTILSVAGHYLYTANDLVAEIDRHQPGSTVPLRFMRHATIYDISITVGRNSE